MPGQASKRKQFTESAELDQTRTKLLEAAEAVFAERGFQAATVREISARSGANIAAINYYFRDKLGLYSEVLERSICANQGEVLREALEQSKTPEEALRKVIHGMLQRMWGKERGTWHMRLMAHEMVRPTPALPQVINKALRPRYDNLRKIIGSILHLPSDDDATRLCAHSVIGQVLHYAHARPVIGLLWPDLKMTPERARQIAEHITDFTLCHLQTMAKKNKQKQ